MTGIVSFVIRILMGGIFLMAGLAKISDPVRFMFTLREFDLFHKAVVPFLAVYLPWLELLLGLSLVLGLLYRTSALMLAVLNFLFMLAILSVISRGIVVDCGCFGLFADALKLPDMADYKAVIRNAIFISLFIYLFFAKSTIFSLEGYIRRNSS
jgi:putative oxidoreductase